MSSICSINAGADIIKSLCRPLETILTHKSIGHLLQFIHIFGYISIIFLMYFFPIARPICVAILGSVILMFYIFGGCILTKAEIYYLGTPITTPGLLLDMIGMRPVDKETDKKVQVILSLSLLSFPIICSIAVNSTVILNNDVRGVIGRTV
jgi:hypothetical protein